MTKLLNNNEAHLFFDNICMYQSVWCIRHCGVSLSLCSDPYKVLATGEDRPGDVDELLGIAGWRERGGGGCGGAAGYAWYRKRRSQVSAVNLLQPLTWGR